MLDNNIDADEENEIGLSSEKRNAFYKDIEINQGSE